MQNLRPFQIGLLAAFAVIALLSLLLLASYQGLGGLEANPYGERVVIWGTLDAGPFNALMQEIVKTDRDFNVVEYVEKDPRTFEADLIDSIAEGTGPDAIVLDHEHLVTLRSKLEAISYDNFSVRTLRDQYVDGFEIFALQNGLYAIPFAVDPMLMYWNRDLFAAGGLAEPPATWESLTDTVERLTLRDATRNILQATVAFGQSRNVMNTKSTLLTLLLQSGSQMVTEGQSRYQVSLDTSVGNTTSRPLFSTMQFYVEFSNVSSPLYSWNGTFDSDEQAFLSERLALYFGYGSEWSDLRGQNPNLNFDVAAIPQGAGANVKRVYGQFYGLALVAASGNQAGAYSAIAALGSAANTKALADSLGLAPAHRTSLSAGSETAIGQRVYDQALIARGWLDPGPEESEEIFGQMIDDVISGRTQIGGATTDTIRRLELAF